MKELDLIVDKDEFIETDDNFEDDEFRQATMFK